MGKYRRELKAQEAESKKKETMKLAIGAGIVLAAGAGVVGFAVYQNHSNIYGTYCKVGNHEVSLLEFDFYYNSAVNSFLSTYGDFASALGLDTSKSFSEQTYSGDETWEDYFQQQALELMKEVFILSDTANEEGFAMKQESYDKFYKNIDDYAKQYSLTVDEYLKQAYGVNANKKRLDPVVRTYLLASDYASYLQEEKLVPTEEEITDYYNKDKDSYDSVTYRVFSFHGNNYLPEDVEDDDYTDAQIEEAMNKAKADAEEFYEQVYDEDTFKELCIKYALNAEKDMYTNDDASLQENVKKSDITCTGVADWLFDEAREEKATAIIEDESTRIYYVVFFKDRYRDESPTATVRHCLIAPEEIEPLGDDATEEEKAEYDKKVADAKAAAKEKAENLYEEWKKNPTEEAFIEMANENSDDGDGKSGGIYEDTTKGSFVQEFDDWVFDESRKEGDNGLVETEFGYHIIYFCGHGEPYWKISISDTIISERYNDFINSKLENYNFEDVRGSLPFLTAYQSSVAASTAEEDNSSEEPSSAETEVSDETESEDVSTPDSSSEEASSEEIPTGDETPENIPETSEEGPEALPEQSEVPPVQEEGEIVDTEDVVVEGNE